MTVSPLSSASTVGAPSARGLSLEQDLCGAHRSLPWDILTSPQAELCLLAHVCLPGHEAGPPLELERAATEAAWGHVLRPPASVWSLLAQSHCCGL